MAHNQKCSSIQGKQITVEPVLISRLPHGVSKGNDPMVKVMDTEFLGNWLHQSAHLAVMTAKMAPIKARGRI